MSLDHIVLLLEHYKYLLLFPLAVVEGPIITVIAGFLVTLGVLNPFVVYVIVVVGDIVGDTFWYAVGRFGHGGIVRGLERFFGVTSQKVARAKEKIEQNRFKMTALFKLTQGVGFAGLVAAGLARVSYPLFIVACLLVTLGQVLFYLIVGLLFGHAYQRIGGYLNDAVIISIVLFVFAGLWIWYRSKRTRT